jgi:hypothetical protein
MFDMSNDSELFRNEPSNKRLPLYEAKMFHLFDHRSSTYEGASQAQLNVGILPQTTDEMKQNPNFGGASQFCKKTRERGIYSRVIIANKGATMWML